jgi:peroxiredoxin
MSPTSYTYLSTPRLNTPGWLFHEKCVKATAQASQAYGVWKEKNMYGKKAMGIERSTFVIAPDGRIEKIYAKVKAKGHAAEVLAKL